MLTAEYDREMDIAVHCREARKEGREEGREEGLQEEKLIIAKNLLAKGSTSEFVQEITGLSLEQIEEIKSRLQQE